MAVAAPAPTANSDTDRIPRSIDYRQVKLFYDVDLDELTVLLYGRDRRYSHEQVAQDAYLLVDPRDRSVVGFEFHHFMRRVVPRFPDLADVIPLATILSDERAEPVTAPQNIRVRLYELWKRVVTPRRAEIKEFISSVRSLELSSLA